MKGTVRRAIKVVPVGHKSHLETSVVEGCFGWVSSEPVAVFYRLEDGADCRLVLPVEMVVLLVDERFVEEMVFFEFLLAVPLPRATAFWFLPVLSTFSLCVEALRAAEPLGVFFDCRRFAICRLSGAVAS